MSEENTIHLDQFEVNALEQEKLSEQEVEAEEVAEEVEETADQEEDQVDTPDEDADTESDDSSEGEEPGEEEAESKPADDEQEKIDKAISWRVTKEKIKREEAEAKVKALEERNAQLEQYQADEAQRQKELQDRLNTDELVPDDVRQLANPNAIPQQQQQLPQFLDGSLSTQELEMVGNQFGLKLLKEEPQAATSLQQILGSMIQSNVLPPDIVRIANDHENGVRFISNMLQDQNLLNEVQLAKYQSNDYETFSLKFNKLADKLNVNSKEIEPKTVKKVKPKPNEPIKSAPVAAQPTDDGTVYLD